MLRDYAIYSGQKNGGRRGVEAAKMNKVAGLFSRVALVMWLLGSIFCWIIVYIGISTSVDVPRLREVQQQNCGIV